jgi:hypothetical protein
MRKVFLAGVAAVTLAAGMLPLAASAGEVYNRISDEQARINAGVRDGQLGPRAAFHLQNQLNAINAERERDLARDGGHLNRWQYDRLNAQENQLSHQIYVDRRFDR